MEKVWERGKWGQTIRGKGERRESGMKKGRRRGSPIITWLIISISHIYWLHWVLAVICPLNCFILQFGGILVTPSFTDSIPQHIYAVNLTEDEVKHSMTGDVKRSKIERQRPIWRYQIFLPLLIPILYKKMIRRVSTKLG